MFGLMQEHPLLVSSLIDHAVACHPDAEIVSRTVEGPIHRCTYRDIHRRCEAGRQRADRPGRAARRPRRHAGVERLPAHGAVLRRVGHGRRAAYGQSAPVPRAARIHHQPRRRHGPVLRPELRGAGGKAAAAADERARLRADDRPRAHARMRHPRPAVLRGPARGAVRRATPGPSSTRAPPPRCATPRAPPACPRACCIRTARPCCTRFGACTVDSLGVSRDETALLVVPMFHVNAWSMPYAGAMSGAKLVLPGPALDGASVYQLLRDEQVTLALGVPTVWMMLLQHVAAAGLKPSDGTGAASRRDRRRRGAAGDGRGVRTRFRRLRACMPGA